MELKDYIRNIPDFPKEGILFRDITPLLMDPDTFAYVVDAFADHYGDKSISSVMAVEARGFLFAAPLAYRMRKPLVLARKERKLPAESYRIEYALEYGTNVMEVHRDSVAAGDNVLIMDDVLATGGTMAAAIRLVEEAGANVGGLALLMELTALEGRKLLAGYEVFTLMQY